MKQELGQKNPAVLMVEMTTQFDRATAIRVIEKLEELRSKLQQKLTHSEEQHDQFQALKARALGMLLQAHSTQQYSMVIISELLRNKLLE